MIYDLSAKIDGYFVLDPDDIDKFSELLFAAGHGDMKRLDKRKRQKLTAYLARANHRIQEQKEETRREITQTMRHFRRFYQFLLLVSPLSDVELHKKYVFVDYLLSWLNIRHAGGGFDLKGKIEASNFVQRKTSEHAGNPMTSKPVVKLPTAESLHLSQDKEEKLSQIIEEINSRLGKDYDTDVTVKSALQIRDILMKSEDLKRSAQHNTVKDFAFAFNDICQTLAQRVQNPAVKFMSENPYNSLPVCIDKGRVQQVITNFVTNAVKYTEKGHIKVGYQYENGQLYIFCEDTGAGIPKEKQAMVFDRFVKLNDFVQGTGLGLSICKSIAESCGGSIGLISDGEGKGSTFWMRIPANNNEDLTYANQ